MWQDIALIFKTKFFAKPGAHIRKRDRLALQLQREMPELRGDGAAEDGLI
jgi:hypothetical protein